MDKCNSNANYLLFHGGFIDGVEENQDFNECVSDFTTLKGKRGSCIIRKDLISNIDLTKADIDTITSKCQREGVWNDPRRKGCKCDFLLYKANTNTKNSFIRYTIKLDNVVDYYDRLTTYWVGDLKQGPIFIHVMETPIILEGYNPLYPLVSHLIYGHGHSKSKHKILDHTINTWSIQPSDFHQKTFYKIFDGTYGDFIFDSSIFNTDKEVKFNFGWTYGKRSSILKSRPEYDQIEEFSDQEDINDYKKSQDIDSAFDFTKSIMYTVKGYRELNGSCDWTDHEITLYGPGSLDNLVGVSEKVYKGLNKLEQTSNVLKLLDLIKNGKILVLPKAGNMLPSFCE